jgi:glycosyltransferase involved in cell wall biosynthesis
MSEMNTIDGKELASPQADKKVVVCIPAYNEAGKIAKIVQKASKYATEVIVYDDGSQDDTCQVAQSSGATVIRSLVNKGYGTAIGTLFQKAKSREADIMVTIDSDGQHDADQIPSAMEPILRGECDIVIGSRFLSMTDRQKVPKYRRYGIKAITKVTNVASYGHITDAQSGFRAYGRRALEKISLYEEGMQISTEILLRARENNLRVKEVPITVDYGVVGTSTHNPILHGLRVMSHTIQYISLRRPLLFYGCPGIALLILAAIFTSNALELFSQTRYVSTNFILVSVGFAVVGAIFLATGAIVYTLVALFKGKLKEF